MYKGKSETGKEYSIDIKDGEVWVDSEKIGNSIHEAGTGKYQVIHNHKNYRVEILSSENKGKKVTVKVNGTKYTIDLKDSLDQVLDTMGISANSDSAVKDLKAPMPGMILEISISEGDELKKGDQVLILEAMKMENILKAPADVTVKKIFVSGGESVEKKQVLIEFV